MLPPPPSPQELCLLRALGLTWILKVFLGLAQLIHLDHKHDAWDQTTDRSEAGDIVDHEPQLRNTPWVVDTGH